MLTLTTNFRSETEKLSATRPVAILKCEFVTGTVYVGDFNYTVATWEGSDRTVRGWIKEWGTLDDVATLNLAATPALGGDLSITLLIPGGREGPDTFWTRLVDSVNLPEQTVVSLYLWFRDLTASTDPPLKQWEGTIQSWRWLDELMLQIDLADGLTRVDKPISRVLNTSIFPNLDPDDVGRIENVIYGSIERVHCHAIDAGPNSTLSFDLAIAGTVLYYSENETPFAASGNIFISAERITYTGKTTETLNGILHGKLTGLTRGTGGTTAGVHSRGDPLVQTQTFYDYLIAGHPCKAVLKVYVTGDRGEPITVPGTDYTVELNWTGATDGIARTRIRINTTEKLQKQIAIADSIAVADNLTVGDNINFQTSQDQSQSQSPVAGNSGSFPLNSNGNKFNTSFAAPSFAPSRYDYAVNFNISGSVNNGAQIQCLHGGQIFVVASYFNGIWSITPNFSLTTASNTLAWNMAGFTVFNGTCQINSVSRTCFGPSSISKTGSAFRGSSVSKSGTVTGNSAADVVVGSAVYADVQGYQDDASGTYTGTPNALIQLARDVLKHFLNVWLGIALSAIKTSQNLAVKMDTVYQLNGNVAEEPGLVSAIAARLAFEAGCWLKFQAGGATITFRERLFSPSVQVTTHRLAFLQKDHGSADVRPVPVEWIINKMNLRYDRDWMQGRSFESYRGVEARDDTSSQARYGIKEQPELFFCNFITTSAHASAIANLYMNLYSRRRNVISWRTRLHHADLEFGDRVRLQDRMAPRVVGELVSANYQPAHAVDQRMPAMDFLLLEIEEADRMWNRVSKTGNYTLVSPADQWTIFDNLGTATFITLTLPPATVGMRFLFYVAAALQIRVDPNGTELFSLSFTSGSATAPLGSSVLTDQVAGKYLGATDVGAWIALACFTAGKWQAIGKVGNWTIEP